MPPFNAVTRAERLDGLAEAHFDLLVIGGGITGAGIARDAAMRGLKTVLVERGDLAGGTSSASSKLVHGGLRYLEHGELGLVFQSVSERHRLRQLAPHLVRPIPFLFPVYEGVPRPLWQISLGLWIYDAMALFRSYKLHTTHRAEATRSIEPGLRSDGLNGSVRYFDCLTDDARLTLETARGAHEAGAWVLTYAELTGLLTRRSQVSGASVLDHITGARHEISATVVVNATGPWTDRTRGLRGSCPRILRPTKGVHLVLSKERLPIENSVVLISKDDKRVVFGIPTGNRVVLGTTDTDFEGNFDRVECDASDVDYLLGVCNHYFPDAGLGRQDVLGAYAGLRPLIGPNQTGLGASEVSREHRIDVDEDGLITIAGGKLTTYRRMAAEVLDVVATVLKREGLHVGRCPTDTVPLPGGRGIVYQGDQLITPGPEGAEQERAMEDVLGEDVVEHLQESYGGEWLPIASRAAESQEGALRIVPDLPYLWSELDHALDHEMVLSIRDFMRRRTQLEIRSFDAAMEVVPEVARRMAGTLGWNEATMAQKVESYVQDAGHSMAWRET